MRARPRNPRQPPSSSYSHAPETQVDINVHEIARRVGSEDYSSHASSHPQPDSPSYILLLPPEILAEIFTYCLPQEIFPIPSSSEAPLLLTQVSSRWRMLAFSTPDLWTALHINYKDHVEDVLASDAWLSRSCNKPVSLSIAIDFGEEPQQGILDVICKHSARWKHVRFDFRHLLCPPMYTLDLAMGNVPLLSTFSFHARDISTSNVTPITNLLTSAPQLREVSWVDDLADTKTIMELPLGRLSHLSLTMEHGTLDYLQVLNVCSNLEHIRITKPVAMALHTQPPLYLPKLTSLNISSDLTSIFDHLTLPALREVRIHSDLNKDAHSHSHLSPHAHSTELWNPQTLLSLIERSACSVMSLTIIPPMAEDTLLQCLRRMSHSLVKLAVEGTGVGDSLLGALTRPSGRKHASPNVAFKVVGGNVNDASISGDEDLDFLCPRLEEISFEARVVCTPDILADMVESRLSLPETDERGFEPQTPIANWTRIRKIRLLDGHRDIERLKEMKRAWCAEPGSSSFSVDIVHRKQPRARTRNYFFRRKLCASR